MKSLLVVLIVTAAVSAASAQLINRDFETGDLTGWTPSNDGAHLYTADDEAIFGIAPFQGGFSAVLVPDSSLIQTNGIALRAGERVSVWMNASQNNGYALLDVISATGPSFHVPWTPVFRPGEIHPVRWNEVSFRILEDGIYRIGVTNSEVGDPSGPSFLGVDLFTITPVPEASTYGLLGAVSSVGAILWRRRKRAAESLTPA